MKTLNTARDIQRTQLIRKAVLFVAIIAVIAVAALSQTLAGETVFHEALEAVGLWLIVICIVGRAWCSLYIGGRKKAEIVDRGPYSLSRNPLYVFSFMGAFGMGAQTGSIVLATVFLLIAVIVFYATVKREEVWLLANFGDVYAAYYERTPRFWPNFRLWRDEDRLEVRPAFFLLTLRDGLAFLIAIPLFEMVETAQQAGWLHAPIVLP
ncbi:isoprenylcysteine carboxylmethyltransferase family protein [Brevundimonas nasdae]|jgi:protein-S-isoprenylcysteine O-methyltransferase Ste14|uniref:methyltransferase family protein n=1 Tax=Brevundimonas nasdae TaxID=172043 RepID=UPI0019133A33|nr:isoprenylcysteine carboxylmethyltransferase family protein [Brevundimonas nasdae]